MITLQLSSDFVLREPLPQEYDAVTLLRNRHRQWFFKNRPLVHAEGRTWLATRHAGDALLVLTHPERRGVVFGTVGWVDLAQPGQCEGGRIVLEPTRADGLAPRCVITGLAREMVTASAAYLARARAMEVVWCRVRSGNSLAEHLVADCGFRCIGPDEALPNDWANSESTTWKLECHPKPQ
jgi:RimJ/RimL family protein N-acetyltransferase